MKKLIAIMLLASLAFSATACNAKETNNETTADNETDTDTEMVYTETDVETFTIATDIELKDRWYPEYTERLIPSTEYGELFVFKGDVTDYKYYDAFYYHDANTDTYGVCDRKVQLYGLCTKDGKTVVDAVYSNIIKEDDGYYILVKPEYDPNVIYSDRNIFSTFFVAKTDGSTVYEHPNKATCCYYQGNGSLATGDTKCRNLIVVDKDGNYVNKQTLILSPFGTAVLYNGEVYVNIDDANEHIEYAYGKDASTKLTATKENYKEYDFSEFKDANTINGITKWQKLNVSGVKAVYNNMYGQDISNTNVKYGILMLNEDNTVSYISIADLIEGKGDATKLDVKDVTGIVSEDNDGYTTYLITADGNKTNVNEYIK